MTPDRYGTEELPLDLGGGADVSGVERQKPLRSIAQARCPSCNRTTAGGDIKLTGLVRQGIHLVWRDHDVVTWGGAKTPCPASGTAACANPAKSMPYVEAVRCPHQRE